MKNLGTTCPGTIHAYGEGGEGTPAPKPATGAPQAITVASGSLTAQ